MRPVVGRWPEPDFPDPHGRPIYLEEHAIVPERKPPDPWDLPDLLYGEKRVPAIGVGFEIRDEFLESNLQPAWKPHEFRLGRQ
jgi:hypothetical protein